MEWLWLPLLLALLLAIVVIAVLVRVIAGDSGASNSPYEDTSRSRLPTEPRGRYPGVALGPPHPVDPSVHTPVIPSHRVFHGSDLSLPAYAKALWAEKGWGRQGKSYAGQWVAAGRRWRGRIDEPYPGGYAAYIWHPPLDALEHHPHRPCFQSAGGGGRYSVHFYPMPQSVDHLITNVETVLSDALGVRR